MKENEKPVLSFVDAMIKTSGMADLDDHQTMLLYLSNARADLDNLIQHWNEALMRLRETPDECDHLECTEDECIGWINGLQIAKLYLNFMDYKPIFLETTARKIHNAEALKLQKKRKKNKAKNKAKNKGKSK